MTTGKETLGLTKKDFSEKIGRIIENHRANSRIIGEPREFVLRSCRLSDKWMRMAQNTEVSIYCRYQDLAGGRRIKMLSLEVGGTKQPVPKGKLVEALYPTKKTASTATLEEKHFNAVKAAMRRGVEQQLRDYKATLTYPIECLVTGRRLIRGTRVDVDHHGKPFAQIADEWVSHNMLTYADLSLSGPPTGKRIKDDILWDSWKEWHREHARLAVVCATANRSKGAAGYATPVELLGTFKPQAEDEIDLDF
jgi:hypothetical protein